jgi:hypothetical protein
MDFQGGGLRMSKIWTWICMTLVWVTMSMAGDNDFGGGTLSGVGKMYSTNGMEVIGTAESLSNALMVSSFRNHDYFDMTLVDIYTNALPGSGFSTNEDRVYVTWSANQVKNNKQVVLLNLRDMPSISYSMIGTNVATVSDVGYITHVADGMATVTVSAVNFERTHEIYLATKALTTQSYYGGDTGTIRQAAENSAPTTTNQSLFIYSMYDPTNGVYVRNTNFWFNPAPACLLARNSRRGNWVGGGVLVTPRHLVASKHDSSHPRLGDTVVFVRTNNTVVTRTITEYAESTSEDYSISRLSEDITGIDFAKFVTNRNQILPTTVDGIPYGIGETHMGAPAMQLEEGYDLYSYGAAWKQTTKPIWMSYFYHYPIAPDSSQPVFISTGTDIILVSQLHTAFSGPDMWEAAGAIQTQILAWGDTNTLSYVDNALWRMFQ